MLFTVILIILFTMGVVGAIVLNRIKYISETRRPLLKDLKSGMSQKTDQYVYPKDYDISLNETLSFTSGIKFIQTNQDEEEEEPVYVLTINSFNIIYSDTDEIILSGDRFSKFKVLKYGEDIHISDETKTKFMTFSPENKRFYMVDVNDFSSEVEYNNSKLSFELSLRKPK